MSTPTARHSARSDTAKCGFTPISATIGGRIARRSSTVIEIPTEGGHIAVFQHVRGLPGNLPADLQRQLEHGAMVVQGQQYGVGRRIDITLPLESTHHCAQPIFVTNPGSGRKKRSTSPARTRCGSKAWTAMKAKRCCNGCSRSPRHPAIIWRTRLATRRPRHVGQSRVTSARTHRLAERTAPNAAPLHRRGRAALLKSIARTRCGKNAVKLPRRTLPLHSGVGLPRRHRCVAAHGVVARLSDPAGAPDCWLSRPAAGPDFVIARLIGQRVGTGSVSNSSSRTGRVRAQAWPPRDVVAAARGRLPSPLTRRQCQCRQTPAFIRTCLFNFVRDIAARRHDLQRAFSAGGQSGSAGENSSGVHRLRQSKSGPDQYGVARHRDHAPPHVRAVEDDDGHRTGARAISDGATYPDLLSGQGASGVFDDNPVDAVCRGRQIARAGCE